MKNEMEEWNIVLRCVVFSETSDPFAERRLPEQLSALGGGWTFRDDWRSVLALILGSEQCTEQDAGQDRMRELDFGLSNESWSGFQETITIIFLKKYFRIFFFFKKVNTKDSIKPQSLPE